MPDTGYYDDDGTYIYFHYPEESHKDRPAWYKHFLKDVKESNNVWMAVAWFTDIEVLEAAVLGETDDFGTVQVILNDADLKRSETGHNIIKRCRNSELKEMKKVRFKKLGAGTWKEGLTMMHHKFICLDSCVWTGSYNLSYQARMNYELMIRLPDKDIIKTVKKEFCKLWDRAVEIEKIKYDEKDFACPYCGSEMIENQDYGPMCITCGWTIHGQLPQEDREELRQIVFSGLRSQTDKNKLKKPIYFIPMSQWYPY